MIHIKVRIINDLNTYIYIHLAITIMESEESRTCKFCGKLFAHRPNKVRHSNYYCKQNPAKKIKNVTNTAPSIQPQQIDNVKLLEAKLMEIIELLKQQPQQSVHYGDNIQNQNVFVLNNYGKETLDHITNEFLDSCVQLRAKGFINLLNKIHFDPSVPENHNLKIVSKKREVMGTYIDGEWALTDKDSVLNELINKGYTVLFKHYIDTVDKVEDADKDEHSYFNFLMRAKNPKSNVFYQLKKDLFVMIENATLYVVGKSTA